MGDQEHKCYLSLYHREVVLCPRMVKQDFNSKERLNVIREAELLVCVCVCVCMAHEGVFILLSYVATIKSWRSIEMAFTYLVSLESLLPVLQVRFFFPLSLLFLLLL